MKTFNTLSFCIIILAFSSCVKLEHLPPVPRIEYKSFSVFDTTDILGNKAKGGRLTFYFEDGDGDIGMEQPAEENDTNDLVLTLYRKTAGVMQLAPENDPLKPSSYAIPFMQREGQNKILKGDISVTFLYLFYNDSDTIMYDFYIKDRANNKSNVATTSEIAVAYNKTY